MALIVQWAAEKAGLDPDKYAGHSLRAGLATSAAQAGVSERSIMAQTGKRADRRIWESCQRETQNALAVVREAERARAK